MFTSTPTERAYIAARRFRWAVKVEMQGADAGWRTLTSLAGRNWVNSVRWRWNLDQQVMTGEMTLHRAVGSASLSPFIAGSSLNLTGAGGTAGAQIDVRRKVRISLATLPPGTTPFADPADFREVFQGYTDKYDVGGADPTITIPFRDLGALLQQTIVETERVYGSVTGLDGAQVMQQILNENADLIGTAIPLFTPVPIPVAVRTYKLAIGTSIMDALNAIAIKVGAVVRYKRDASGVWQLTFYVVDRSKTTPDYTFATSEPLAFESLDADIAGLRNVVLVPFTDSAPGGTGNRLIASAAASTANLLAYGRQTMILGQDATSQINSLSEGNALAAIALSDTSLPYSTAKATHDLTWWVEGGDLYSYAPDGKHSDAAIPLAVMQIEHTIQATDQGVTGRTVLTGRATVAGFYRRWGALADRNLDITPTDQTLNDFRVTAELPPDISNLYGSLVYSWTSHADEVWAGIAQFPVPAPADPWAVVKGDTPATGGASVLLPMGPLATGVSSLTVPKPAEGFVVFVQVEARSSLLEAGDVRRAVINASPSQIPVIELDDSETATVGTQWWSITERGLAVTQVQVQTQVGSEPISAFVAPTRGPGAVSVVRGGVLGAGQYEHDVTLDATRFAWIMPRLTLAGNDAPMVLGPFGFDRNKNPNIVSVSLSGTVLNILCDTDTRSIKVTNSAGTWVYQADGLSLVVDVSKVGTNGATGLGATASDTYSIIAQSDPLAYVGGGTLTETKTQVVNGATAPPAGATWMSPGVTVTAPATTGSDVATINLLASAAPAGYTVAVFIYVGFSSNGTPTVDHTADLSPALSSPPTVATDYSYSTGFPKSAHTAGTGLVTMKVRADLKDAGGVVKDTRSVQASWYSPV